MSGSESALTSIVIFGASGDLTRRKLVPALYQLHRSGKLPEEIRVVGLSRSTYTDEQFRSEMRDAVASHLPREFDADAWSVFEPLLHYVPGDFQETEDVERLRRELTQIESRDQPDLTSGGANRLYYLATPPQYYATIARQLGRLDMEHGRGWRRLVVEKPFGRDLKSAQALNRTLHEVFDEDQIFRIDHYLGKETAQNILFFRFANTVFEPVWNRQYVDHVQISVLEEIDIGTRGGYYDSAGVIRDMFQNHLLQLMSLVAMEPPVSFEANHIRDEKVKLLRSIRDVGGGDISENVVAGQYRGYRETEGVSADSLTPTYAALRLWVDNWRWRGVPFYLRSGKALAEKNTNIIVYFDCPPHLMFPLAEGEVIRPNYIALCIQPNEGIHLRFEVKVPGTLTDTKSVDMEFRYREAFEEGAIRDAYVRLLLDAINGDASLFARHDGIERSWEIVEPLLGAWESADGRPAVEQYEPGAVGPESADRLIAETGRDWSMGCDD